jgi:hypothetical protein
LFRFFTKGPLGKKKTNIGEGGEDGEAGEAGEAGEDGGGGGGVEEVDSGDGKLRDELDTHIDHDDDDRHGRYIDDVT